MPNGLGTVKGLSVGEQIATALQLSHEEDLGQQVLDKVSFNAVLFEASHTEEEIVAYREDILVSSQLLQQTRMRRGGTNFQNSQIF